MRILITLIVLSVATVGHSQVSSFFKLYSDQGDDSGQGVVELLDSSYAVTGSSSSFIGGGGSQAFLLKIDSAGGFEWSTHYGGLESEGGRRIMHVDGVGYFIAGYTNSYGNGGYDFYLVKTDLSGNMLWEKTYGGVGWERVLDAVLTRDSGVIMIGETSSNFPENKDMWIVRTDKNGDTLWTKTIGGPGDDVLESIDDATDSTYYLAGHIYDPILDQTLAYSMHLDEDGTIYWVDSMGGVGLGDYYFHGICVDTVFNELIAVGHFVPDGETRKDQLFARITYTGGEIGFYSNAELGDQVNYDLSTYGIPGNRMLTVAKFDATTYEDGDDVSLQLYQQNLGHLGQVFQVNYPMPDEMAQVVHTQDGGVITVGSTSSQGDSIGMNHIFIGKVGMWNDSPSAVLPHNFEQLVSVEEGEIEDYLTVYPNPTSGILTIESSISDAVSVRFISALGQEMLSVQMHGIVELDLYDLPSGIYYMMTSTSSGISNVRKIIIKH